MKAKTFNQSQYLSEWSKKNMAFVNAKYKKEFVHEFKKACAILQVSQSELIKEQRQMTIDNARSQSTDLFVVTISEFRENNLIHEIQRNDFLTKEAAYIYYLNYNLNPHELKKISHLIDGVEEILESYPL